MHICHMIYNIYSHAVSQVFIYLVTFLKHWQSIFLQCCSSGGLWVDVMPPRTRAVAYTQKRMICEMKIEIGPQKKSARKSKAEIRLHHKAPEICMSAEYSANEPSWCTWTRASWGTASTSPRTVLHDLPSGKKYTHTRVRRVYMYIHIHKRDIMS